MTRGERKLLVAIAKSVFWLQESAAPNTLTANITKALNVIAFEEAQRPAWDKMEITPRTP